MHELVIEFDDRQLNGSGRDCVGEFTLAGEIQEDMRVQIVKKYLKRHSVVYVGEHDGEGLIYGTWALFGDHGTFAMKPAGGFRKSDAPILEFEPR